MAVTVTKTDLEALAEWLKERRVNREIQYRPARVLMQDFTGVPAVVDLAAMRDAMKQLGGDPQKINPLVPVHLVIDHSVMVDEFGTPQAFEKNVEFEYERNGERYEFLKWGSRGVRQFQGRAAGHRHLPPGQPRAYRPVRVDVATTRTARASLIPTRWSAPTATRRWSTAWACSAGASAGSRPRRRCSASRCRCWSPKSSASASSGELKEGITATDLVLTVTQMLRAKGVVGRFVEFYGPGLDNLPLADRATIANMAPEYGATCGFFPIDERTIDYLKLTGRDDDRIELVRAYAQAQGMWRDAAAPEPVFTDTLELDMSSIEPSLAGPKRPQDRVLLSDLDDQFNDELEKTYNKQDDPRVAGRGRATTTSATATSSSPRSPAAPTPPTRRC